MPIANATETQSGRGQNAFRVLGIRVDAVQIPDVVKNIEHWIQTSNACHYIAVTGMHGITEAQHDPAFKHILNSADLCVPDGMPLVWLARYRGFPLKRRVYGPELMQTFCSSTGPRYRHFLYGGLPGVPERLADLFTATYSNQIAGIYSPPFRALTDQEDEQIISRINASRSDVLWVGLSTPKQERWIYQQRLRLRVPVVIGVGAAFDINSGTSRQAPSWMREHGLEWLFRLGYEPRRLWRRYLIYGSEFVWKVVAELLSIRSFE